MRIYLRDKVRSYMPEEVRAKIREVKKYSYNDEKQEDVETSDTIWIPSVREVFYADLSGMIEESFEKGCVSYTSAFPDNASRVRGHDGEPGSSWWWLRSDNYFYSFVLVDVDGTYYNDYADTEGGVVIGFCL